jgi:hypothetical protein
MSNFSKKITVSPQVINLYLLNKIKNPSTRQLKNFYFATNGKITPNIIYNVKEWQEELKGKKLADKLQISTKSPANHNSTDTTDTNQEVIHQSVNHPPLVTNTNEEAI